MENENEVAITMGKGMMTMAPKSQKEWVGLATLLITYVVTARYG